MLPTNGTERIKLINMDKHLNNIETQIQLWMETKGFDQLSSEEQKLVLSQMTKDEYILGCKINAEAKLLFNDLNESNPVAPPLITTNESKSFWFKSHPIYHTGIAVAATILIMLFVKLPSKESIRTETKTEYISHVDTIYQTTYIHDTVKEIKEKPVIIEKIKYVEVPSSYSGTFEPNRMLNPAGSSDFPLKGIDEHPPSTAFTNDAATVLVQDLVLSD